MTVWAEITYEPTQNSWKKAKNKLKTPILDGGPGDTRYKFAAGLFQINL